MDRNPLSRRAVLVAGSVASAAGVGALLCSPIASAATPQSTTQGTRNQGTITVANGQTVTISQVTKASAVIIADGGTLTAPSGYSLSMTVNGVETGQRLTATGGADTAFAPGTYRGDIVLTPAVATPITWAGVSATLVFPFRQALYVDGTGVVSGKSVLSAVTGGRVTAAGASGIAVSSTGECFDGIYVDNGVYTLDDARVCLIGNGRCDFVGYGAAVVGESTGTRLVLDGVDIANQGAVRTGVIANDGATVIVKNSRIATRNGVLPSDYVPTVDTTYMESAPWMLSISGNVRATNLLGTQSIAAYVNSVVESEGWGVLSSDSGTDCQLAAINSEARITGRDGYGSYAIGNATERFLGVHFDVATYANINRGGAVHLADSTRAAVASVNSALNLGLTSAELNAIVPRPTTVDSRRFGFMWHGAGTLDIAGGTIVNSRETTFLDKGQQIGLTVDGSGGVRLNPGNGVLFQLMENDDPGPVMVDGKVVNEGVYTEPTGDPVRDASFDVTAVHDTDAVATFTDISLTGDFYNAIRGGAADTAVPGGGLNLVLTFDRARVAGVISATASKHHVDTITAANYWELGEVTNTVGAVVNNGVLVTLGSGSRWTVTGTSYLSKLAVDADARVTAAPGRTLTMTVNGATTAITPGHTYAGAITLTVS